MAKKSGMKSETAEEEQKTDFQFWSYSLRVMGDLWKYFGERAKPDLTGRWDSIGESVSFRAKVEKLNIHNI